MKKIAALITIILTSMQLLEAQSQWNTIPNSDTKALQDVAFVDGRFIAVGNAFIRVSPDVNSNVDRRASM